MSLGAEELGTSGRVGLRADEIRALRKRKGLSLVDMAKLIGISPTTLESWESGKRSAFVDIDKMAQVTDRSKRRAEQKNKIDNIAVRTLREILGASAKTMAHIFNCSSSSWYSMEQGRRAIPKRIEDEIVTKYSTLIFQVKKLRESMR